MGIEGLIGKTLNLLKSRGESENWDLLIIALSLNKNVYEGEAFRILKKSELRKFKTFSTY